MRTSLNKPKGKEKIAKGALKKVSPETAQEVSKTTGEVSKQAKAVLLKNEMARQREVLASMDEKIKEIEELIEVKCGVSKK